VNVFPTDGIAEVDLNVTLKSSPFSDTDIGDEHAVSQWQITTISGDYDNPTFDSGEDGSNLIKLSVPPEITSHSTTYYWRVRHQDNYNAWSNWSEETSFTTMQQEKKGIPLSLIIIGITVAIFLAIIILYRTRVLRH
jgi:hypothetical protein